MSKKKSKERKKKNTAKISYLVGVFYFAADVLWSVLLLLRIVFVKYQDMPLSSTLKCLATVLLMFGKKKFKIFKRS